MTKNEEKQPQTTTPSSQIRCFKCQGLGHIAFMCQNCMVVTLVDEKLVDYVIDEEEEELIVEEEGETIYAD